MRQIKLQVFHVLPGAFSITAVTIFFVNCIDFEFSRFCYNFSSVFLYILCGRCKKGMIVMFDYYGSKWKRKRKHILRLDGYICQVAKRYGRTEEATVVHHIYPADEYPEWAWEDWNLISVSQSTHNKIENRKTGELTKLGIDLQRRTTPGVNWRKK